MVLNSQIAPQYSKYCLADAIYTDSVEGIIEWFRTGHRWTLWITDIYPEMNLVVRYLARRRTYPLPFEEIIVTDSDAIESWVFIFKLKTLGYTVSYDPNIPVELPPFPEIEPFVVETNYPENRRISIGDVEINPDGTVTYGSTSVRSMRSSEDKTTSSSRGRKPK